MSEQKQNWFGIVYSTAGWKKKWKMARIGFDVIWHSNDFVSILSSLARLFLLLFLFCLPSTRYRFPDRYSDVYSGRRWDELAAIDTNTVIHSIGSKWSEKERPVITSTASSTGLDSLSPCLLEGFSFSFFSFHSLSFLGFFFSSSSLLRRSFFPSF